MKFGLFKGRKAQSATEYLMTYGWAILAIAIVGALLYTQVISAKKCAEGATGFDISGTVYPDGNEYAIDSVTVTLSIALKNNVGKDVTITSVDCPTGNVDIADVALADGATTLPAVAVAGCTAGGTISACYTTPITIHYVTSAGIVLKAAGTLNGKY